MKRYVPIASLALLSIATLPAQAQSRCDRPHLTSVDSVACAKAAEGITPLRLYVWRTRMIHNLYLPHYVSATPEFAARAQTKEAPKDERHSIASVSR